MTYNLFIAYLLWFLGAFGLFGLHRFYLRRYATGFLWLFTGGLFLVGAVYDFFSLPRLVEESNLGSRYREALFGETGPRPATWAPRPMAGAPPGARRAWRRPESVERVILRLARQKGGVVTPGEVALEGDVAIEEAKSHLDRLVSKGYAELEARPSGAISYIIPDFRPEPAAGSPPS